MSLRNLAMAMACTALGSTQALGLVIDGRLSDWGATVAGDNNSTFDFLLSIGLLGSHIEDQNDNASHSGFLGPNRGGQDYDAEMMAVAYQGGRLLLAIVTGQRPDNGRVYFAPGDIRIETSAATYAIEVGGGPGGADGSAITHGAPGSTYELDNKGFTTNYLAADPLQTAGSIWTGVDWLLDTIAPKEPTQFRINEFSRLVGTADYVYTRDTVTDQHANIELSFDISLFSGETIESIHWRPACGNDELDVAVNFIPEPVTLILLALGSVLVAWPREW